MENTPTVAADIYAAQESRCCWGFQARKIAGEVLKEANSQAAFMPFGWDPQIRMGQNSAMMEGKMGGVN